MRKSSLALLSFIALGIVAATVCAAPWSSSGDSNTPDAGGTGVGRNQGQSANLVEVDSNTDSLNNPDPSPMQKLSTSFSKAGSSIKGFFKPSSAKKTTTSESRPASDPLSLSSNSNQPSAEFYLSVARLEERSGNLPGAIQQCQRALEIAPDNLAALLALARLYDRQGDLTEATKRYQATIQHYPKEPAAHNDLGLCYARQQKLSESTACLRMAVELQPDKLLYRNNLATVLVEQGQIDEALQFLAKVHGKSVAHYNIGFLLNKRGKKQAALEQFQLAVAGDPTFDAARQWVAALSGAPGATTGTPTVGSGQPASTILLAPSASESAPAGGSGPALMPASQAPAASDPPAYNETRARSGAQASAMRNQVAPTPNQLQGYRAASNPQQPTGSPVQMSPYPTSRY